MAERFRDFAVGGDGAAIKISHNNDDYGNFDVNFSYGASPITDKQANIILSEFAKGEVKQDTDIQASIYWQPAFSPWRFGASYLDSDFSYQANDNSDRFFDGGFSFQFYTVNALYEGERWEFSGEVYQERFITKGFYHPLHFKKPVGQGAYLQSRYKLSDELTLLARYERFYSDKNDKKGKKFEMKTNTPRRPVYRQYGIVTFTLHDSVVSLPVYESVSLLKRNRKKYKNYLFLPIKDATSFQKPMESNGSGRYLELKKNKGKTMKLDFNELFNPYCAYTDRFSCPITPEANVIDIRIEAGEKATVRKEGGH